MSRVPGTFKTKPDRPVRSPLGREGEALLLQLGALHAEAWVVGECQVMCAREPRSDGNYWWHVSISHNDRYPTWDEIKAVVYGIPLIELPEGRTFAQLLGPVKEGEWVNMHENCFHFYEIDDPS
jgi:hypothetical protein